MRPLHRRRCPSGVSCSVVMRLLSDVNGISFRRGNCAVEVVHAASRPSLRRRRVRLRSDRRWTLPPPVGLAPHEVRVGGEDRCAQQPRSAPRAARRGEPSNEYSPSSGSYPAPETSSIWPATKILRTVISSFVRVPVLSAQMTETLPSVSDRGQAPDQRVSLDHPLRGQRQRDRDHGRQRLGDDGDGQRCAEEQHLEERLAAEQAQADDDEHDRRARRAPACSADLVEAQLQEASCRARSSAAAARCCRTRSPCPWRRRRPARGRT